MFYGGREIVYENYGVRLNPVELMLMWLEQLRIMDPAHFSQNAGRYFKKYEIGSRHNSPIIVSPAPDPLIPNFYIPGALHLDECVIPGEIIYIDNDHAVFNTNPVRVPPATNMGQTHRDLEGNELIPVCTPLTWFDPESPRTLSYMIHGAKKFPKVYDENKETRLTDKGWDGWKENCALVNEFLEGTRKLSHPELCVLLSCFLRVRGGGDSLS